MPKREVPKLNKDNFIAWQSLMKLYLGSIGDYAQSSIITEHVDPIGTPSAEDLKNKQEHNQTMLEIASALNYAEFDDIKGCNTALKMCKALSDIYGEDQNVQRAKRESLRGKFDDMKIEVGENVAQYGARIKEVVSAIRCLSGQLDDDTINNKFLRTFHPIYAIRVSAIQELRCVPGNNLSLEGIIGRLTAFDLSNFDNYRPNNVESAFKAKLSLKDTKQVKSKKERKKKYVSSDSSTDEEDVEQLEALLAIRFHRGKGKFKGKMPIICFNCNEVGHIAVRCTQKKKDYKEGSKYKDYKNRREDDKKDYKDKGKKCYIAEEDSDDNDDELVYVAMKDHSDEEEPIALVTCMNKNDRWIIDSGCSYHMTGDKSKFVDFTQYDGNSVRFGNDAPCQIKGKRSIKLPEKISCDNAYYVEGLNYNLLSVSQLGNVGCKVEFGNKTAKIYDTDGKLIGKGDQTRSNLFYLDMENVSCFVAKFDDVWLWHKRLCHVNFDNLLNISKMKKVRGLPKLKKPDNIMCKLCQLGKMTRSSFKSKTYTSKEVLELVHTDLCGPIEVLSYKGDKYIMFLVDDYSRMMTIMFLKKKSDSFQMFKWYVARVEKETGKSLKCLRSDRGGEFTSNEFEIFSNDKGIKRQTLALRTPPQNGIAERINRSMIDCARTLMMEKIVALKYWRETISAAVHTLN